MPNKWPLLQYFTLDILFTAAAANKNCSAKQAFFQNEEVTREGNRL